MMIETGNRSRSHGIPAHVLQEQADCIGAPIQFVATSWQSYEENFSLALRGFKDLDIERGVFGDIDLEDHRQWVERICESEVIRPWMPLWKTDRVSLLEELIDAGFRAEIIALKDQVLPQEFLGRTLDAELIHEFDRVGIDLCGEIGEYHTIVTDGPIFSRPLDIIHGKQVLRDGYWFSDVSLIPKEFSA